MTNVDDATLLNRLRVYPNPFTGRITVETIDSVIGDSAEIRLHDLTGKVLLRQTLTASRQTLETGELPAGYYGLEYWSDGSRVAVQKLLKMK